MLLCSYVIKYCFNHVCEKRSIMYVKNGALLGMLFLCFDYCDKETGLSVCPTYNQQPYRT